MPRETIRRLSTDVERLLVAGAHLGSVDEGLAKSKTALDGLAAQLGAKGKVIAQLAEAAGKALTSSGDQAAREVLSLATMTAQVRAAQAQVAKAPEHASLPVRPAIASPCNAKELGDIAAALLDRGKGRMEIIRQAIDSGDIVDLRLVDAIVYAMGDGYIGELLATEAVPKLGPAIVAPIRATLDISKGRTVDGRRLRALVAADPAGSRELLLRALAEGSPDLRQAALASIANHLRGAPEFEQPVLTLLSKERAGDVAREGLRALAGYASEEALQALHKGLGDVRTLAAAAEALGHSPHLQALPILLEQLDQAVKEALAGGDLKRNKASENPAVPAVKARELLRALAHQRDPRVATATLPLIEHLGAEAAAAALGSASPEQLRQLADYLTDDDDDLYAVAVQAAAQLDADEAFQRMSAAFAAKDRTKKQGLRRIQAVAHHLCASQSLDIRWFQVALDSLSAAAPIAAEAARILGQARNRDARDALLDVLDRGKDATLLQTAIHALAQVGDAGCVPAILRHHQDKEWSVRWAVQQAVESLAEPSTVASIRSLWVELNAVTGNEHWMIRNLLRSLERRFPGA
jgi:hypothetical protein